MAADGEEGNPWKRRGFRGGEKTGEEDAITYNSYSIITKSSVFVRTWMFVVTLTYAAVVHNFNLCSHQPIHYNSYMYYIEAGREKDFPTHTEEKC